MAKTASPLFDADALKTPDLSKFYTHSNKTAGQFGKFFINGKAPLFDVEAAIATQRKNVEALTAANRVAFEGVQAVFRRQAELVRESVDELSKASKEFTTAGSTEDKLVKQTEPDKTAFETPLANVRELPEIA